MINANELMVYGYVYKITNLITGKLYFGITRVSINVRWHQHKHNSVHKKKKSFLNHAINKYGAENFKIELFKTCYSGLQMYKSEQYFIKKYNTNNRNFGYNNSIGGEKSSLGKKLTMETRKKLSEYQKSRIRKPFSESTIALMREKAKGRDTSLAWKASANQRKGVALSVEHRRKVSVACIGKGVIPVNMLDTNMVVVRSFSGVHRAAKETGILQSAISNVLTKRAKTAGGYIWQYA